MSPAVKKANDPVRIPGRIFYASKLKILGVFLNMEI
jgi:hypothetical protein